MFDYDRPEKKQPADWTGLLITVCIVRVFFLFVYLGRPEMGFTAIIVLGLSIFAIKLRWRLRKHVWVLGNDRGHRGTPCSTVVYHSMAADQCAYDCLFLPAGMVDFVLISGALTLAEKFFSNRRR